MGGRSNARRWRRLERWQVLLAAIVAGLATLVTALVSLLGGGPRGVTAQPPLAAASSPSAGTEAPRVSVAITGLHEQPFPPPPGRSYTWSGTVRNEPRNSSILVIAKRLGVQATGPAGKGSQSWLVSPGATISKAGSWTVTWVIPKPPSAVQWIAVVWTSLQPPCASAGCPSLRDAGPKAFGVLATAIYHDSSGTN